MREKGKFKLRINIARGSTLFFAIMTLTNFFIVLIGKTFYLPYSSFISVYSLALAFYNGEDAADINFDLKIPAYVVTILVIVFLILCYLLSKKRKNWLLAATVFAVVDGAAVLFVTISQGYSALYLLDILMHGIMIFYGIRGVTAYAKIGNFETSVITADDIAYTATPEDIITSNEYEAEKGDKPVLYDNSGKQLYSGSYKNKNIILAKKDDEFILVINGFVSATSVIDDNGQAEIDYVLNGETLKAVYDQEKQKPIITINDNKI